MLTFPLYIQFSFLFQVLIHVSISILLANNVYVISNIYFARATKYYLQLSTTYLTASYQFCPALASSLLLLVDQNLSSGGHKAWSSLTVILSECNCPRVLECPTRCLCLELPLYLRVISLKTSKERDFQVMNLWVSSPLARRGKQQVQFFACVLRATESDLSSQCICSVGLHNCALTSTPSLSPFPNEGTEAGCRRITCSRSRLVNAVVASGCRKCEPRASAPNR